MAGKRADMVAFSSPGKSSAGATGGKTDVRNEIYRESGVDTAEADAGLNRIIARVQRTWPAAGLGRVVLPIGYFANVIELDGIGLALCTDGVGSKTIIADMMGKYDTIGIDCVAMNVNDMICVGAKPLSMVDYIAVAQTDAAMLDAIAQGLCKGAEIAGVSISGGETAQLKDLVKHFDLVGMAVGRVALDKVIDGRHVREGDVVIGVKSSGIHSNGLSLARKAFFAAPVGYEIDRLIEPHPIFPLIQRHAGVDDSEMFEVFNMGIGFCYVVDPAAAERTLAILKAHGRAAQVIGTAISDPQKIVRIPARVLAGQHKRFWREERGARRVG